jgi:hypothetical protein
MSTIEIEAVPISLAALADGAIEARFVALVEELQVRADEQPALYQEGRPCYATTDGELVGTMSVTIEARLNPDTGSLNFYVKKCETKLPELKIDATPARLIGGKPMIEINNGRQLGIPLRKQGTPTH